MLRIVPVDPSIPASTELDNFEVVSATVSRYCMTSKCSHALQASHTCSITRWCPMLHPKVALEAHCGIQHIHDGILHAPVDQCWMNLSLQYLPVTRCMSAASIFRERVSSAQSVIMISKPDFNNICLGCLERIQRTKKEVNQTMIRYFDPTLFFSIMI